ncbi:TIGR03086 family metal-binding protein [Cellulomonas shaoxiangyii]|uniref:TIGR03086 family protein n=1 Tax=Cellulomonas shaoxiangyii TaxID=2566013 RepID=A0A4P7SKW9_9CELL|nr:TIGR03086 family metal-binding protein [Cellulomonas shaoxiangyii]QCB94949.1 TIGR03086 family protein [Cellulomonas shaoxiangyii]TGY76324.1 TIGR03086 family protein [Cellulomonas shaoxiangyii]
MTDNPILDAYTMRSDGFAGVLDAARPAAWDAPSPCEGWTGRDVVAHVVDTQREYLARHDVDLGPRPDLAEPAAAWHAHADAVRSALALPGVVDRPFEAMTGPSTLGATFDMFYGFDMVAHRWDVAAADGRAHRFTDADLDVLEGMVAAMGEHLYGEGVCAPPLDVPADADRQTRALAALGRRATVPA